MTAFKPIKEGKVREIYDNGNSLIMVATDRISAFDVILKNKVTKKGTVLTQMSKFWFDYTKDLLPNHMLSVDVKDMPEFFRQPQFDGNSMLCRKLTMLPIECIVRGYITGSGWASYQKTGKVCGIQLPEGLQESQKLDAAHLAGLLVAGPAAAGDVAAHDALDGQHGQLAAQHAVAVELGLPEELRHILHVHAQHMVGQQILGVVEPELADLGEHGALFGHLVFQDDIKRRNAVGGNHDQAVAIVVNFTDFAFFDGLECSHSQTLHFPFFRPPGAAHPYSTIVPCPLPV